MVTLVIQWPRVSLVTKTGKESKAKNAGRLIPWLSHNVVNNLPGPVYRQHKIAWREAARHHLALYPKRAEQEGLCMAYVRLYKATSAAMDPFAVLEGLKPIIDGLQEAGLLRNDRDVVGGRAEALKAESRDECRIEITLREVAG